MAEPHYVGQRISYNGALCTVRYVGEVTGTTGTWLGVEWDDGTRGKHNGSHKGVRYFSCRSNSPNAASLVRPTRPADKPQSFISALREKYAPDETDAADDESTQIKFGSKVAQEMGFDKIRRKFAQVKELKSMILDGMRIHTARDPGEDSIGETCPNLTQLDLGRNLFTELEPVMDICEELSALKTLRLNGNRFQDGLSEEHVSRWQETFPGLTELTLKNTLLDWEQLCSIASNCVGLTILNAGINQFSVLPSVNYLTLSTTLTSLSLEYNEIRYISKLESLTELKALRNLHLKGNSLADVAAPDAITPVFGDSVQYLDVSYNQIESWSFVDSLPTVFPGLTALRIAHNPVYDMKDEDTKASSSEEAHMFTVARLAALTTLNFSQITPDDRMNAEMFYLSRIAKQLAAVPESAEDTIKSQHPRFGELCEIYGEPDIVRREEVNPSFLEARLLMIAFVCDDREQVTKRIPKSFDIYAVKGIAGGLFELPPIKLRLVWETGEWDPVAGFDDESDDSDEEDENLPGNRQDPDNAAQATETKGRWIKREVELADSPRQLGYVVDGPVATIRVEPVL